LGRGSLGQVPLHGGCTSAIGCAARWSRIAQLVELATVNRSVVGSSPTPGARGLFLPLRTHPHLLEIVGNLRFTLPTGSHQGAPLPGMIPGIGRRRPGIMERPVLTDLACKSAKSRHKAYRVPDGADNTGCHLRPSSRQQHTAVTGRTPPGVHAPEAPTALQSFACGTHQHPYVSVRHLRLDRKHHNGHT
jgi:hypothetical protein